MGISEPTHIVQSQCEVPMDDEPEIMQEKVRSGVRRVRVRKAASICDILPEMSRAGGEMVVYTVAKRE